MNKHMKKLIVALLVVLVFVQAGVVTALADSADAGYRVRIYAGNIGAAVNGSGVAELSAGFEEDIEFDASWVKLPEGSPYYVKGIRKSGQDNNTVSNNVIHVTEDTDYVVAYGIKGKLVAYHVYFVEEGTGRQLHEPQTYYGNVGEKPVISYLYVDGYQPQAYHLTKTLSDNEANNTFTFTYKLIVHPTATPIPTSAPSGNVGGSTGGGTGTGGGGTGTGTGGGASGGTGLGGTVVGGGAGGVTPQPAGNAQPGGAAATAQPGATAAPAEQNGAEATAAPDEEPTEATEQPAEETAEPTEAPTEELEEEQTPLDEGPKDLIDLDEEETPLGEAPKMPQKEKSELQKDREQKQTKFYIAVALLAASLTGIVVAVVLVIKKSRAEQR